MAEIVVRKGEPKCEGKNEVDMVMMARSKIREALRIVSPDSLLLRPFYKVHIGRRCVLNESSTWMIKLLIPRALTVTVESDATLTRKRFKCLFIIRFRKMPLDFVDSYFEVLLFLRL